MRCFRSGSYAFQAGKKEEFPVVRNWPNFPKQVVWESERTGFYASVDLLPVCFILVSRDKGEAAAVFELLYDMMPMGLDDYEPMMNLLAWRRMMFGLPVSSPGGNCVHPAIMPREMPIFSSARRRSRWPVYLSSLWKRTLRK